MRRFVQRLTLLVLSVSFLLAPTTLHAAERPNSLATPGSPFVLAVEKDYPPFLYADNTGVQGISYQYAQLIARKLNRQLTTTEPMQLQMTLDAVRSGQANLLADVTKTTDREQYLAFSDSFTKTQAVIIGRSSPASKWDVGSQNAGRKIAVGKAYGVIPYLKAKYPAATLVEVPSDDEVTHAVAFGTADVGVLDTSSLAYLAQKNPLANIEVVADTDFYYELSFAVAKADASIIPEINRAISEVTPTERETIFRQWQSTVPRRSTGSTIDYRIILLATGMAALAGLLGVIWIITLRRSVRRQTQALQAANARLAQKNDASVEAAEKLKVQAQAETSKVNDAQKAMLNILEDVDEEKRRFEILSNQYDLATNAAQLGIWEWDIVHDRGTANDIFLGHHNLDQQAIQHVAFSKFFNTIDPEDKDRADKEIKAILANKNSFDIAYHFTILGDTRVYRLAGKVDRDATGAPIRAYGIEWDVTREQEIDKQKSEFVSLASHQLRTPLTAIRWQAELLMEDQSLNEQQRKTLDEIYKGNIRMIELVNSLLNVSRLDLDTYATEVEAHDMKQLTHDVIADMKAMTEEHQVKIVEHYDEHMADFCSDDKIMKILVLNLLTNAVKYSPPHSTVELIMGYRAKGTVIGGMRLNLDAFLIQVSDHGIGIPKAQQSKIFGKMFRADNARNEIADGSGLGLYLVKEVVEKNHGHTWFTSAENQGTTFYIILPASGMVKKDGTNRLN